MYPQDYQALSELSRIILAILILLLQTGYIHQAIL
jgi:hypothetical protein